MSLSNFAELELLDHVLGNGVYTAPTIYVALGTGATDASLTGEPAGSGYARVAHASWATAAARSTNNTGAITFPEASGSWGTITHYALYDAATVGNMIAWGALSASVAVVSGNTPSIATTTLTVTFDAGGTSNFLALELLDHLFGVGAYTPPTIYAALSTADPTDAGSGLAEPANNYARPTHASWNTAAAGAIDNNGVLSFAVPSGTWGLITYCALMDAITSGNMLFYGTATPNQTPENGDTVQFADTAFALTLT